MFTKSETSSFFRAFAIFGLLVSLFSPNVFAMWSLAERCNLVRTKGIPLDLKGYTFLNGPGSMLSGVSSWSYEHGRWHGYDRTDENYFDVSLKNSDFTLYFSVRSVRESFIARTRLIMLAILVETRDRPGFSANLKNNDVGEISLSLPLREDSNDFVVRVQNYLRTPESGPQSVTADEREWLEKWFAVSFVQMGIPPKALIKFEELFPAPL